MMRLKHVICCTISVAQCNVLFRRDALAERLHGEFLILREDAPLARRGETVHYTFRTSIVNSLPSTLPVVVNASDSELSLHSIACVSAAIVD